MAKKNSNNKSYDKGYRDGKNSNFIDQFAQSVKGTVPLPNSSIEDSYDAGYEDGLSDKHDSSDSNYSGGTSESSSGCFITTATIQKMNKEDDCEELTAFRQFRDNWLTHQKDGKTLIEQYYNIAPKIVVNINKASNSFDVYDEIWNNYLSDCFDHINSGNNGEAKRIYINMVNKLSAYYLN